LYPRVTKHKTQEKPLAVHRILTSTPNALTQRIRTFDIMTTKSLSLLVTGPGLSPQHRSHWSLALHFPDQTIGRVYQVSLVSLSHLLYIFDVRDGVDIRPVGSEGSFELASGLDWEAARRVEQVVRGEEAPRDGVERCQDWVLRVVVGLEVEGLVESGTAEMVGGCVGRSAREVRERVGGKWVGSEDGGGGMGRGAGAG
jgi:hypothetical protein